MPELLDTDGVAQLLNIKPTTVRWYHKRGFMPPADRKFGRALVWERTTIEEWDNKRKEVTPTQTSSV